VKKVIFTYVFVCMSLGFRAQFSAFTLSASVASASDEAPYSMAVDSVNQFIYSCGFFSQNNAFTYTVPVSKMNYGTGNGKRDGYLCKYDFSGNLIWMTNMGSSDDDVAMDIVLAPNGNLYLTGYYKDAARFNSVSGSSLTLNNPGSDIDVFVCCYNSSGDVLWAKSGGGNNTDKGHAITSVSNGIWISGYYNSSASFGPFATTTLYNSGFHTFLMKYDFLGNEISLCEVKSSNDDLQGESENQERYNITSFNDTVYAVGIMGGNNLRFINAGGSPASPILTNTDSDANFYIVSFTNAGQLIWARQINNQGGVIHGCGLAADCNGVYVSGTTHNNSVFPAATGYTLTTGYHDNPFVVKLFRNTGYKDWVKYWNTTVKHDDVFSELFADRRGNLYAIGSLISSPALQPDVSLSGLNGQDIVVAKLTTSGNFQWAKLIVGSGDNFPGGFWCNTKYFFLAGNYYSSITLQTSLTGPGNQNIFLTKGTMVSSYTPGYCCNAISPAVAGPSQTLCASTTTLAAITPSMGAGYWSLTGGTLSITTPTSASSSVTGIGVGTHTLQWAVSGNCSVNIASIIIQRDAMPSAAIAGNNQTICATATTLAANVPSVGTGSWSLLSGSVSVFDLNSPISALTNIGVGTHSLQWSITNGVCPASTSTVLVKRDENPTAAVAGPNQMLCSDNTTLTANTPLVGTGSWSVLSGTVTPANPNSPTTSLTNIPVGTHSLQWQISNGVCPVSNSTVTITRNESPTTAYAGPSQSICAVNNFSLSANAPLTGVGTWSVLQGNGVISNTNNPNTTVSNLSNGLNTFVWSISTASCGSSTSTINVQVDYMPSAAYAGTNVTTNSNAIQLNANTPTVGVGSWIILSGGGSFSDANDPNSMFTEITDGENVLVWQIRSGACPVSDDTLMIVKNGLFIPELITPNSDGSNDVFYINTIDNYKAVKLEVFDRWGNRVYVNEKYNNEFAGKNQNGEKLVDDVYYIILTIPEVKTYTGTLTIKER
jgi:gliding motility-associated-like protein